MDLEKDAIAHFGSTEAQAHWRIKKLIKEIKRHERSEIWEMLFCVGVSCALGLVAFESFAAAGLAGFLMYAIRGSNHSTKILVLKTQLDQMTFLYPAAAERAVRELQSEHLIEKAAK